MANEYDAARGFVDALEARRGANVFDFAEERAKRLARNARPAVPWKPYPPEDFSTGVKPEYDK